MTAQRFALPQTRWLALALVTCLAFIGLFASSSAQAAQKLLSTINLCITKSGPDKGKVRFVATKAKCKGGELRVRVVSSPEQGVLGIEGSSGATGATGPQGPKGDKGDQGLQGLQGPAGADGADGLDGADGTNGLDGAAGKDGVDGVDGEDGEDGAPGPEGKEGKPGASLSIIGGGVNNSPSSDTAYAGMFIDRASTSTQSSVQQVMPVGGTLSQLAVRINTPPSTGSGNREWTFTVMKGASATGSISCVIPESDTETTCASTVGSSMTFAAGDLISLRVVRGSSNIASPGAIRWSALFNAN